MLNDNQDRQHLGNKVGRDAASAVLKELYDSFPKNVIPYEVNDTWVETKYNPMNFEKGCILTMRFNVIAYTTSNVHQYFKTGHQSHIFAFSFRQNELVSEMYNKIKAELITFTKSHALYKVTTTKTPKIKTDSNLLLLL